MAELDYPNLHWGYYNPMPPMTVVNPAPLSLAPFATPAPHYEHGRKHRPLDVIHDWGLNFNLGNAVKYIARIGRKQTAPGRTRGEQDCEDAAKAIAYLQDFYERTQAEERRASAAAEGTQ